MQRPLKDFSLKLLLRSQITTLAKSLGFDLIGFSPAQIQPKYLKAFKSWLKNGYHADMAYMEKIQRRANLQKIFPGARTVIVLGTNYYYEQKPLKKSSGRVARYAYGWDYHKVIGKKLKELEKFICYTAESGRQCHPDALSCEATRTENQDLFKGNISNCRTKSYVDTGPLLERALAEQAGLGRIGKNGCLISKEFGSWIFLSEIITTLDLNLPAPMTDRWSNPHAPSFNVCGNCTRCIQACPTGAIIAPGVVDSRLCISYLTIENRKKIPSRLAKIIKKSKRLFGCDICQEGCPHNRARQQPGYARNPRKFVAQSALSGLCRPKPSSLDTPIAADQLNLKELQTIKTDQQFLHTFAGSPLMRAKRKGLIRNTKIFQTS